MAVASAALGILLAGPMSGCKKAHVEEATVFTEDVAALQALVSKGADLNARNAFGGDTPLLRAASNGNERIVELLATNGADPNLKDQNGWSALMWAASDGNVKIAGILLENGAEADTKDREGRTALMRAASKGQKGIVELLIEKGANVNAVDAFGMTPLKCATVGFKDTDTGQREIAKMLRDNGAKD